MSEEITLIPTMGNHVVSVTGWDHRTIGLVREDQPHYFAMLGKDASQQLCLALIEYFKLDPADVFDDMYLQSFVHDNYPMEPVR